MQLNGNLDFIYLFIYFLANETSNKENTFEGVYMQNTLGLISVALR